MSTPTAPAPTRPSWREILAAARTRRMLGLFALLVVAAVVCVRLGAWQIDRAFTTAEASRQAQQAELAHTSAVPLADVLQPGAHLMGADVGRPVSVSGQFVADREVLIPDRAAGATQGYLVLTPFVTDDGAWLPVVRGLATDPADVPAAPSGPQELLGSLAASEAYRPAVLPAGQQPSISSGYFAGVWGTPIYNAYLVQADSPQPLIALPRPELDADSGASLRNLAYAAEWFVFGGFALVVWYRLLRDEALERRLAD